MSTENTKNPIDYAPIDMSAEQNFTNDKGINIASKKEIVKQRAIWSAITSTSGSLNNYPRPMGNLPMYEWGLKLNG